LQFRRPMSATPQDRRLLDLPHAVEASALAEFNGSAMLRGTAAFALVACGGWLLLGWRGWLQHMTELWVAHAVAFALIAWLRARSGAWVPAVPLLLVLLTGPLFGAALAVPLAFLPSLPEDRTGAAIAMQMAVAFLFALSLALAQVSFGLVLQRQRRQAETRQRALILERELLASRLNVLQAQIEPHFLYNTLSNVQALTRKDPAAAEQMLTHLIEYLRSAMPAMRSTGSTLGRELALARAYLSIMQFRMGPRLQFSVEAAADLLGRDFPPTIIGTLIENAIKHGLEPAKAGGRIDVRACQDGGSLVVEVADTGIGFSASAGSGVGLANARERLTTLHGPQAELDLTLNEPTGVVARARVPLAASPPPMSPPETSHTDGPRPDRLAA